MPTSDREPIGSVPPEPLVNHGNNVHWQPAHAFRPSQDIEELCGILRWVEQTLPPEAKIKAGGSRHSWSEVAATDGVYLHPEGMTGIDLSPPSDLRADLDPERVSRLLRIGAGTTIRQINHDLWVRALALPWLGGFDGQTLAGVLPTGTHGSVLQHGPLAEMALRLDLVLADGTKIRIEPDHGITDKPRFLAQHPDWRVEQKDDLFHAALVHLGALGVVHSLVVEAVPKFYLNEVRTELTGQKAEDLLRGGNLYHLIQTDPPDASSGGGTTPGFESPHPRPAFHLELLWNVHTDYLIVTTRHPLPEQRQKELAQREPPEFYQTFPRDLFHALRLDKRYTRDPVPTWFAETNPKSAAWLLEQAIEVDPEVIPGLVDGGMKTLRDTEYTNRSYNVFNIGRGQNQVPSQSATISVPLRGDRYLDAMDVLRQVAKERATEHRDFMTGPISMRFVRGSKAFLADPEDVCKFELIFGGDNARIQALASRMTWAFYQALYARFGGGVRLHWGQLIPDEFLAVAPARLRESYPRFTDWLRIRDRFDPKRRFVNAWQEQFLR
jgi:FAD binding domain-containing protein/D-arabinono-1,4-lactone oxidase